MRQATTTAGVAYGDLARAFPDGRGRPMSRGKLDRVLRDYARELPEPSVVGGMRIWPPDVIDALRVALAREAEGLRM